jgi:VanZ family protein
MQIIGGYWVYAGVLEYLQQFSPGRHPSIADFTASAFGALRVRENCMAALETAAVF